MLRLEQTLEQLVIVEDDNDRQLLAEKLMSCRSHAALMDDDTVRHLVIQAIPVLKFPAHWEVKIIPSPDAAARFLVNGASVYLDMVCELGHCWAPYWEVYAGDEPVRIPMLEVDELLELIGG